MVRRIESTWRTSRLPKKRRKAALEIVPRALSVLLRGSRLFAFRLAARVLPLRICIRRVLPPADQETFSELSVPVWLVGGS